MSRIMQPLEVFKCFGFCPVLIPDSDIVITPVVRHFMRPHQNIETNLPDFRNQVGSVFFNVSRQVVITGGALAMAIIFVEP